MARNRTAPNRSKSAGRNSSTPVGPKVRMIKSSEDRSIGSGQFMKLDDDEKFTAHALFDPDPGVDGNPGYAEYAEHWDNQMGRFVPCWGAKNGCIYCKAGQQASDRALGAFLKDDGTIGLFRMNKSVRDEWIDTFDEDGSTLGQKVRIKCLDRRNGEYSIKFFEKDRLSQKDLKTAMADIEEDFIENLIQRSLNSALEALRIQDVLESDDDDEDDDDDDVTPKPKNKGTTKKNAVVEEEEDEDEEEEDEDEDEEDENGEEEDGEETDEDDEDEDEEVADEDDEDEEETPASLNDTYTVKSVSEAEFTFTLEELDSDVYVASDLADEIDFDDYKKGDKVTIVAQMDDDNDWVATSIAKKRGRGRPKKS